MFIPFIIAGSPALGFKQGQRSNRPTCLEHLKPTLLALAAVTGEGRIDGVNLVPTLWGKQHDPHQAREPPILSVALPPVSID